MENVKGNKVAEKELFILNRNNHSEHSFTGYEDLSEEKKTIAQEIELMACDDLKWLTNPELVNESTDWKLFVAFRIRALIFATAYKKNQAQIAYEKQENNEMYHNFLEVVQWIDEVGYIDIDTQHLLETLDLSELFEKEEEVKAQIGYVGWADIIAFKENLTYMLFDSPEFQELLKNIESKMHPLLMNGLHKGLQYVDLSKSGREVASYINKAISTTYHDLQMKEDGIICVRNGEEKRFFKPKLSKDKDCWLFLLNQTFTYVGVDKLKEILTKSQFEFVMQAFEIVEKHYKENDTYWFRYTIDKKSCVNKKRIAEEMGMSDKNYIMKMKRIQNKIDLVWSDMFEEFLLSA